MFTSALSTPFVSTTPQKPCFQEEDKTPRQGNVVQIWQRQCQTFTQGLQFS